MPTYQAANSGYTTIILYEYDDFLYPIGVHTVKSYLVVFRYDCRIAIASQEGSPTTYRHQPVNPLQIFRNL